MPAFQSLIGQRFGRLVVKSLAPKTYTTMWECLCDCGKTKIIAASSLKTTATKSCGCWNIESAIKRGTKHGMSKTKIRQTWEDMIRRTKNGYCKERYSDKGIGVSDEWLDFDTFKKDMGNPMPGMTIDRIDNNRGYSKENCRWATWHEQSRNRCANVWIKVGGYILCLKDACLLYGVKSDSVKYKRNRLKITHQEAFDLVLYN